MSVERLLADTASFAKELQVGFDVSVTDRVFSIYRDDFETHPVEFRTTTKPNRELSYRFVELGSANQQPQARADAVGLIDVGDHPVGRVVPELGERFEFMGYGVDFGAASGLEKIWPFLDRAYPTEKIASMESIPAAVGRALPWLSAHGLTHASIVAADYVHHTMNIYFPLMRREFTVDDLSNIVTSIGFPRPEGVMRGLLVAAKFANVTFDWRSADPLRVCFYLPLMPQMQGIVAELPKPAQRIMEASPFLIEQPMYILGPTWGKAGSYLKIESDYQGRMVDEVFPTSMQVDYAD